MAYNFMTIQEFAAKYGVRRLPSGKPSKYSSRTPIEAGEDVIDGRAGYIDTPFPDDLCNGVSARRNGILALNLIAVPRSRACTALLNNRARLAEAAGMKLRRRNGDETAWYFDANDEVQSRAAISIAGCAKKRTRVMTDEQKAVLTVRLTAARLAKSASVSNDAHGRA